MLCSSMAASFTTSTLLMTVSFFLHFTIPMAFTALQDTLKPQQLFVNNSTLISANKRFELGFFSPSKNHTDVVYLGIWYKDITPLTVVWVAKGMHPLQKTTANLVLDNHGVLTIQNGTEKIWRSDVKVKKSVGNPNLQLIDSGNLVVQDSGSNNGTAKEYIWESFDYPTNTLLPGMKLGWDFVTGLNRVMASWKSEDDPSEGEYMLRFDSVVSQQLVLQNDLGFKFRVGPWDGSRFSGTNSDFSTNGYCKPIFISNLREVSFGFEVLDNTLVKFTLTSAGDMRLLKWRNDTEKWITVAVLNKDFCDQYSLCGPNGLCHLSEPTCGCLNGFEKRSPDEWNRKDFSSGCKRKIPLKCSLDGFRKYEGMKLPDRSVVRANLGLDECRQKCLEDCNCTAYTSLDLYGNGSQCVVWKGDLIDIRRFPIYGDDIYIRTPLIDTNSRNHHIKKVLGDIGTFASLFIVVFCLTYVVWHISITSVADYTQAVELSSVQNNNSTDSWEEDSDIIIYDFTTLSSATNNFSPSNKLGQGGFGVVYKGELGCGQQVAVKKLIQTSSEQKSLRGIREFDNEVSLISRLQHRNLVRILGYCVEGDERLLVFEYLPNGSLYQFIFDESRRQILTWPERFKIITEVAKGLVYLHDDSRVRVIHCDMKAGNILLDDAMNPKISDFGIARIAVDDVHVATKRFGTNGYMSPELLMSGRVSTKSDVFSFGVLALELISGKKNWGFRHHEHRMNLVGHAWKLWVEARSLELVDTQLDLETFSESEMARCIQVSLLCVQQRETDRPDISSVLNMLRNETVMVPAPHQPFFFNGLDHAYSGSLNELTMSSISGR